MKYLKPNSCIHILVHLGSGHCSEMPDYQQLQPEKILLIEGDEEVADSLQQEYGKHESIKVINALVGTNTDPLPFYRFSLTDANSLYAPKALYEHFPGIRLLDKHSKPVQDAAALVSGLALTQDQNLLVVDLPGNTLEVLQHLHAKQQLEAFSQISVYLNQQPLYEGEVSAEQCLDWLNKHGYELSAVDNQHDIERPCYQLNRSSFFLECRELEAQLNLANTQHQQALAESQVKTTSLESELEKAKALHQQALKEAQVKTTSLESELEKAKAQHQQALKEAQVKTTSLESELEKAKALHQQALKEAQVKTTSLESELEKAKAQHQQALKEAQAKTTALQTEFNKLTEEKDKVHGYFVNRKKQAEDNAVKVQELTESLKALDTAKQTTDNQLAAEIREKEAIQADLSSTKQNLSQAQQTIVTLQNTGNQLQQLENKVAELISAQSEKMQEYTNVLGQHVTRSAKHTTQHLEAFLGVQKYLVQDGTPLQLNGSRIPADLALKITERLHNTHYDLIIEFGSGTTTLLFAKALLKQEQGKTHSQHLIMRESSHEHTPDLPKRIISFEHNKAALKTLEEQLAHQSLDALVETVFAPLTDFTHKGEEYLFYDCKAKLDQLAKMFAGREAKVLILVDGPYTPEGIQSRYPALPKLLKYLAAHQLDLLVPQPETSLPSEAQQQWQALLQKRCLAFKQTHLSTEKGCLLLQINT